MISSSPGALLRLARRDARRNKGRSLLILLSLILPLAGLVAAVTLVHALTVPRATKATWAMGSADAILQVNQDGPASPTATVAKTVPAGSRTLLFASAGSRVLGPDGLMRQSGVTDLDYTDPLASGMVRQLEGRAPRTAGEVAVSASLADATHITPGSRVVLRDVGGGRTTTVVGIAETPRQLDNQQLWVAPGTLDSPELGVEALVRLPPGNDVDAWAAKLVNSGVRTRDSVLHPPNTQSALAASASTGLKVLVAGLALLEAVLMAGAAFGVGARRSQRDLALLAATGGDAGQVRGVVLSGALVLGAIAGVTGAAAGVVIARLLLPHARSLTNHEYTGLHPRPLELVGAVLLGVITALVSAWLPARGAARAPVVASLQGRRGIVSTSRTRIGLALTTAAIGTLCCAWAGRTHSLGTHQFNAILLFAAIAELGFAGCAPSLVGLTGRLGGRAPLTMRLSLRDISRNRSRTGPAVAAIMATLSGVVAMGVYTASTHARHVADFVPALPAKVALLQTGENIPAGLERRIGASLDATGVYRLGDGQAGLNSARVAHTAVHHISNASLLVAGPDLLKGLGIPQAGSALAAGKAVVINGSDVLDGQLAITIADSSGNESQHSIPAVAATVGNYQDLGAAIVSPARAKELGLNPATNNRLWTLKAKPGASRVDAANALVLAAATTQSALGSIQVENGLDDSGMLLVPLALLAISTLVTFGVTAIATALSAAESKGDFATLSAVGATPFVRRKLAMGQAGVLALLGGVLGIAAGLVPVSAVIAVRSDVLVLTVPWQVIALALLVVPLIAALGAGLFTRSRLPLSRRLT